MTINDVIEKAISNKEDYLIGYADMDAVLEQAYQPFRYAIVLARKYDHTIIEEMQSGPTPDYANHYDAISLELAGTLKKMKMLLTELAIDFKGILPLHSDKPFSDDYLNQNFSFKMAATRAGLGWIGKTGLLVTTKYGPRIKLGALLVDYPFETIGTPITGSQCGSCTLCVTTCPAQAATGASWEVGLAPEPFYDPFKCRDNCHDLSKRNLGVKRNLCGICMSVCPIGRKRQN